MVWICSEEEIRKSRKEIRKVKTMRRTRKKSNSGGYADQGSRLDTRSRCGEIVGNLRGCARPSTEVEMSVDADDTATHVSIYIIDIYIYWYFNLEYIL